MKRIKTLLAALFMAASTAVTAAPLDGVTMLLNVNQTAKTHLLAYSKNIVKVSKGTGGGSGTFISPTHVLTNHHVVKADEEGNAVFQVIIQGSDGVKRAGIVVGHNPVYDLALVRVVNYTHPSKAQIASRAPEKLASVWALGHPMGNPLIITTGTYQYHHTNESGEVCEVTTAPIFYGNSGGSTVVFEDNQLKLLGVPTSIMTGGWHVYPHGACSVSYKVVRKFIRQSDPNLALEIGL